MAIDNTICTAGDHNYLWGLFLLIASMRRFGMDEPVIVGTKGFESSSAAGRCTDTRPPPVRRRDAGRVSEGI